MELFLQGVVWVWLGKLGLRLGLAGEDFVNLLLVDWLTIIVVLELVVAALLTKDLETIYSRQVGQRTIFRVQVWVRF